MEWFAILLLYIMAIILGGLSFMLFAALKIMHEALEDAKKELADIKKFVDDKQQYVDDRIAYLKSIFPLFF